MRHIGQKLLALTLALLLWYMVNDTRLGNKLISRVPLQFDTEHLPGNMYHEISGQPYASFTIRGPQEDIRVVDSGNFVVSVPLRGVNVGENTISLTRDTVSAKDIQEHLKHGGAVFTTSKRSQKLRLPREKKVYQYKKNA